MHEKIEEGNENGSWGLYIIALISLVDCLFWYEHMTMFTYVHIVLPRQDHVSPEFPRQPQRKTTMMS